MAELLPKAELNVKIILELTEAEARALVALSEYGENALLNAIENKVSTALATDHKDAIIEFFRSIRYGVPNQLIKVDHARAVMSGKMRAVDIVKEVKVTDKAYQYG